MKKWSFGVLAFLGLISFGLLLGLPSMSYGLDTSSSVDDSSSALVEAHIDSSSSNDGVQDESTSIVEADAQVDKGASSEASDQVTWHQGWISPE